MREIDDQGNLWFLSAIDSFKNRKLAQYLSVTMYFQGSAHAEFLHMHGSATVSQDKARIKSLWSFILKTWFTEGEDDPRITAIKFTPSHAYYWDNKYSKAIAGAKISWARSWARRLTIRSKEPLQYSDHQPARKNTSMSDFTHLVCPHCEAINRVARERLADQPVCGKCAKALFVARPLDVSCAQFDRHIGRNDIPVLVDFWAAWCGPCKMMAPAFQQAAQRLEPAMRLLKVNTEAAQDLASRYNIRSIPTLALFRGGREIARQPGAMDLGGIIAWAQAHAGGSARPG